MEITMIIAIPPEDYKGSQGDWHIALIERGLWDGEGWHGDIEIPSNVWWEIFIRFRAWQHKPFECAVSNSNC